MTEDSRADCECPTNSVEQAIRNAHTIFRGEVVSASLATDDSQNINFVVAVDDAIRGSAKDRYSLTTALPDSCGVPIRLGFHDLYVLEPGKSSVSSCTGSGRVTYMKYPLLATAIALVDLPVFDSGGAQRLLSKQIHSGYDRATVDEFFKLVAQIDPRGSEVKRMTDRIEYREIVVHFEDGKFVRVELL